MSRICKIFCDDDGDDDDSYWRRRGLAGRRLVIVVRCWTQCYDCVYFDVEDRRHHQRWRVDVRRVSVGRSATSARPHLLLRLQPCRCLLHRQDDIVRRCSFDNDDRVLRAQPPAAEAQRQIRRRTSTAAALYWLDMCIIDSFYIV